MSGVMHACGCATRNMTVLLGVARNGSTQLFNGGTLIPDRAALAEEIGQVQKAMLADHLNDRLVSRFCPFRTRLE